MKNRYWMLPVLLLVLINQAFLSPGLAKPELTMAVLSDQDKWELSKLLPIDPVLSIEMQPDPVDVLSVSR